MIKEHIASNYTIGQNKVSFRNNHCEFFIYYGAYLEKKVHWSYNKASETQIL